MPSVLVIDDNADVAKALRVLFTLNDIECQHAISPEAGLLCLRSASVDLVIQDMNFSADTTSGREGVALFHKIREIDPDLPIVLLTAWANLETAVELVKAGAADYLSKPWDDPRLLATVKNLLELGELQRQSQHFIRQQRQERLRLAEQFELCGIVYESSAMQQLLHVATQIAHAEVPVLIMGPNGSGKEKVAEIIQANSACRNGPFVKVNVGALPNELMEAELFGAEAGAYTSAQKKRIGRFEAADRGTLFLDEIGNLSSAGQIKLLRVLQSGEFERLGSHVTQRVQVRIISATNVDLKTEITSGNFREDLYYRLNVITLTVPALAERKADILPLARSFLDSSFMFLAEAEEAMLRYRWPGNVRELQNSVRRAMLLCQNRMIRAADLGDDVLQAVSQRTPLLPEAEPDCETIKRVLLQNQGVVARAARQLGLSRQALYRRMQRFGIAIHEFES